MRYFSPCLVAPVFMMGLVLATPRGISRGGLLQIGEESQMDVGFQRDLTPASSCLLLVTAAFFDRQKLRKKLRKKLQNNPDDECTPFS